MKENESSPTEWFEDPEGDFMRSLFDIERGIERAPLSFRTMLSELIDRIIEKRLEYYLPEEEEDEVGS